mmetsp:Transcript_80070/g.226624  ORF Transcript_80070/g.226624 Transcript_80070/m.226624 type:complete len:389 (+) Transcript_80070:29-1195(+)
MPERFAALMVQGEDRLQDGRFGSLALNVASTSALAAVYMGISTGLIGFNKFLMHEGRFPFAISIGLVHMSSSFGFNAILYQIRPSLYPSLTDPTKSVEVDRSLILGVLLPIAVCFAAQLVLSNIAFMHSSVAFLQMMKESNVVLVYIFSLALSLEHFSWVRGLVLLFVVGATALTIHGEVHLSYTGFALQGVSIICESMKLTLQSYSLSATGRRLDALTYVLLITPLVFLVLLVVQLGCRLLWPSCPEALWLPPWSAVVEYRWMLLANGFLAFAMNISHSAFIKQSSAITFILTGIILKDVMIVVIGSILMGDTLSRQQVFGFAFQLVGIVAWSLMKAFPQEAALPKDGIPDYEPTGKLCSKLSRISSDSTMAPLDDETMSGEGNEGL